jgi:membrane-associated phospholipid phosphatase
MYGSATLIGLSRMYNDQHWASDVMLAAGIGTLSGITVVRFNHAHPRNVINRWFLSTSVIPTAGGGMALAWSMPTRW